MTPPTTPPDFVPAPGTYNFAKVLESETDEIQRRRLKNDPLSKGHTADHSFAVAFSGGGIRSACVALGIVQSLAEKGILMQADYLSGISGGGYLLGWLTAWIKRDGAQEVEKKLANNAESGKPPGNAAAGVYDRFLEPEPIHHLRRYSSYLTPRMGLLSGDTLAMASIYLRNVSLNQVMLVAALMALTLLLQLLSPEIAWANPLPCWQLIVEIVAIAVCFFIGIYHAAKALWQIDAPPARPDNRPAVAYGCGMVGCLLTWHISPSFFYRFPAVSPLLWFVGVLALLGLTGSLWTHKNVSSTAVNRDKVVAFWSLVFAWLTAAALTMSINLAYRAWLRTGDKVFVGDSYVILGMPGILLGFVSVSYLFIGILGEVMPDEVREWLARIFGYFLASAFAIAGLLAIMLDGPLLMEWMFDAIRQGGWHAVWTALLPGGWLFVVVAGVLGGKSSKTGAASTSSEKQGNSTSSSEKQGNSTPLDWLVVAAPPVFLVGLLLLVSWGTHKLVIAVKATPPTSIAGDYLSRYQRVTQSGDVYVVMQTEVTKVHGSSIAASILNYKFSGDPSAGAAGPSVVPSLKSYKDKIAALSKDQASAPSAWSSSLPQWWRYVLLILAATALATVLAIRLSVNEFSMHLFYRNRLARAFLGASNTSRKPNWFTGFAEDDIRLNLLTTAKPDDGSTPYDGPYPLWGTTLNLTVGEDLAWQQRKGASFLYSPLFSGWDFVPQPVPQQPEMPSVKDCKTADGMLPYGYRCNRALSCSVPGYGGIGGAPTIGTAMAASGAAASPNMGYHTRPGVAALLAIFNVRLGWWTGNPRHEKSWAEYSPSAGYLLKELLGSANDRSKYIYLSDGGHFENLGIYELVRRRVRFIICSDADADEHFAFQDLGNAVERCRRDFGVEIEIQAQSQLEPGADPYRAAHYAIGKITYPGQAEPGILLYIKSSLTNDEPSDVLSIRSKHRDFPHDTTGNQFFDEPLFEAYRALGQHMMNCVLDKSGIDWEKFCPRERVKEFFQYLLKTDNASRRTARRHTSSGRRWSGIGRTGI